MVQREAALCDSGGLLFISCRELQRPLLELGMRPLLGHKTRSSLPLLKQKLYWCTDPGLWPGTVWSDGSSQEALRVTRCERACKHEGLELFVCSEKTGNVICTNGPLRHVRDRNVSNGREAEWMFVRSTSITRDEDLKGRFKKKKKLLEWNRPEVDPDGYMRLQL